MQNPPIERRRLREQVETRERCAERGPTCGGHRAKSVCVRLVGFDEALLRFGGGGEGVEVHGAVERVHDLVGGEWSGEVLGPTGLRGANESSDFFWVFFQGFASHNHHGAIGVVALGEQLEMWMP